MELLWLTFSHQGKFLTALKDCKYIVKVFLTSLITRFGWAKVLKFHPVLIFSCLLHGQKLKLAEVYLNPNLARFDKISTN